MMAYLAPAGMPFLVLTTATGTGAIPGVGCATGAGCVGGAVGWAASVMEICGVVAGAAACIGTVAGTVGATGVRVGCTTVGVG